MYYISTGEKTKMYTLRSQENDYKIVEGERVDFVADYYIRNLSTDANKAVETAKLLGYEVSTPEFTLEEIQRRQSEEVARIAKEAQEEKERLFRAKELEQITAITEGFFPFGRYNNQSIKSIADSKSLDYDFGYCKYWLSLDDSDSVIKALKIKINAINPEIKKVLELSKGNDKFFGDIKTKYKDLKATCVSYTGFDGYYGWTDVITYALDSGELIVYMGASGQSVKVGEKVTMSFTVKSHDEYRDLKQTKAIRIKLT